MCMCLFVCDVCVCVFVCDIYVCACLFVMYVFFLILPSPRSIAPPLDRKQLPENLQGGIEGRTQERTM